MRSIGENFVCMYLHVSTYDINKEKNLSSSLELNLDLPMYRVCMTYKFTCAANDSLLYKQIYKFVYSLITAIEAHCKHVHNFNVPKINVHVYIHVRIQCNTIKTTNISQVNKVGTLVMSVA